MSQLQQRIDQFRKMATDDPENDLAHYRLGQLLAEDNRHAEAVQCYARTRAINPQFSKVYQLLGETFIKLGQVPEAVEALTEGWKVADERGDKMPRDAMEKLLKDLGAAVPQAEVKAVEDDGIDYGFRCDRPGCSEGKRAKPLDKPPVKDAIGARIQEKICSQCWDAWFKDYSVKVINELRLDLSTEFGQSDYDKHLREFMGFEPDAEHAAVPA